MTQDLLAGIDAEIMRHRACLDDQKTAFENAIAEVNKVNLRMQREMREIIGWQQKRTEALEQMLSDAQLGEDQ